MKTRSFLMILFCCLSLFSCKNTKQSPPANILPKATVEDILLEMCLIDGEMKVLIFNYPIEELKIFMNVRMEQLFTQYHTDYNQFTESYTYYMSDIKTSKQMLEDVTNRLIKRQTEEIGNPNTEKSDN